MKNKNIKMKFKDAPVGARFKYPNMKEVWVKINSYPKSRFERGDGLIAQWNGNIEGFQSRASFSDKENGINFETEVELIEPNQADNVNIEKVKDELETIILECDGDRDDILNDVVRYIETIIN